MWGSNYPYLNVLDTTKAVASSANGIVAMEPVTTAANLIANGFNDIGNTGLVYVAKTDNTSWNISLTNSFTNSTNCNWFYQPGSWGACIGGNQTKVDTFVAPFGCVPTVPKPADVVTILPCPSPSASPSVSVKVGPLLLLLEVIQMLRLFALYVRLVLL